MTLIVKKRNPSESGNFDESTQLVNPFSLVFLKAPLSPYYGFYSTGWGLWGFASELDFSKGDKIICKVFLLTIIQLMQLGRLCLEI